METIQLSFRYSEADFTRAMRAHYLRVKNLLLPLVLGALFIAGSFLDLNRRSTLFPRPLGLIFAGAYCSLVIFRIFIRPSFTFRNAKKLHGDLYFTFTDAGVQVLTSSVETKLQWDVYLEAFVDKHNYLLYLAKHQFQIIPKRFFESNGQQQAFEQLLSKHIPKITRGWL